MTNLVGIIKDDFTEIGPILKGIMRGIGHGIYTPMLINTGIKQAQKISDDNLNGKVPFNAFVVASVFYSLTATVVGGGGLMYASSQGKAAWYLGALALTNTADYLVHAYKRSKE